MAQGHVKRSVIVASSLGTVFEWYDFYLYGTLAIFFGRLGDLIGRKHTFLVTIIVMWLFTALVGFIPTYAKLALQLQSF